MRTRYPYSKPLKLFLCSKMKPCACLTLSWVRAQHPLFSTTASGSSKIKGLRQRTITAPQMFSAWWMRASANAAWFSKFRFCSEAGQQESQPHPTRVYALTAASVDTKVHSFIVHEGTVAEPGHLLWHPLLKIQPHVWGKCASGAATSGTKISAVS